MPGKNYPGKRILNNFNGRNPKITIAKKSVFGRRFRKPG